MALVKMKLLPSILLVIFWLNLFNESHCQQQTQLDSSTSKTSERWRDEEDEENKIERITKFKRRQAEPESEQNDDGQFVNRQLAAFLSLTRNPDKFSQLASFDGWFHDLNEVHRGAKGAPLTRLFQSAQSNVNLPNVFKLSESLLKSYEEPGFSSGGKNLLFVYFGLFTLNEIVDAHQPRCSPSYREVPFPELYFDMNGQEVPYRPTTNHSYMILNKLEYCKIYSYELNNPPRKTNTRTSWIDGETVYGDNKFCADQMRTFSGGHVIDISTLYAKKSSGLQCFNAFGSTLINENPFTWTILSIWLRWHNIVADAIAQSNQQHLSDETVYQEARKLTVATMQNIIVNEWLPVFLGQEPQPYSGHQAEENAQITDLFDAIVPSYLYSLVSSFAFKVDPDCSKANGESLIRVCNSFDEPLSDSSVGGVDKILAGLLLQSAETDDHTVVEDIRRFAKGPIDFTREDLIALHLHQTRDFNIPDYLSVRQQFGLSPSNHTTFEQLARELWPAAMNLDKFLVPKLQNLYDNSVQKIDVLIGALLENDGTGPGQLIAHIVKEQFDRIRRGDRFYFENGNGQFNQEQIQRIKAIKFSHVIKAVSNHSGVDELIAENAFLLPTESQNQPSAQCRTSLQGILKSYQCTAYGPQKTQATCTTLDYKSSISIREECTGGHTMDLFIGSELFFVLTFTFLAVFIVSIILLLKCLVYRKNRQSESVRVKASKLRRMTISDNTTLAQEWVDDKELYRSVEVVFNNKNKSIKVRAESGSSVLRSIYLKDVTGKVWVQCNPNKSQDHMLIRVPNEYDLVLKFESYYEREKFIAKFEAFLMEINITQERHSQDLKTMFKFAYTKSKRQRHLEQFFRVVFSHAFNKKTQENIDMKTAKEVLTTELTQIEFAEALSMRPESTFVQQMFSLIDKDNNGYISFREFLDIMVIFAKGSAEQKIKLMFDMYDVNQNGRLSINDFKGMIKSLLEIANQSISPIEMDQTIHSMLNEVGFASKKELSFEEFNKLFSNYKEELGYSELNFDLSNLHNLKAMDKRQSALYRANDTIIRAYSYFGGTKAGHDFSDLAKKAPTFLKIETHEHSKEPDWLISWIRFVDARKQEIFFIVLYTLWVLFIFVDKAYYYTYLNESSGLRQIAGLGVTITRGSASVLMFTFSTILVTMCRNLITFFRETFLNQYIPFDGAVSFHKYIAFWAFFMSIIHATGHCFNFYHISTQRPQDINCLFREIYFLDNEMPKFHTWLFKTPTGITGILLLALIFLIYIFAIQYSRRHVFNAFWRTHNLYPILYILIVVHGLGKLIQPPIFYFYFLFPITLFTLDRLISASRKKVEISVIKATLHPSNVTHLEFKKPPNFDYKSGQWMRIACLELNSNEYHPFTIASAPHEETLSMFIRAVGPFTKNLRQIYDCNTLNGRPYPKLYLDGPYGEGHQDWLKFDVSVLVGGGIGITPFASIIKDISFRSRSKAKINCKKVYFLWVTRTQKHFEWMSDVIRETESKDRNNLLVSHIFITQFYEKFDLRTTMLYICERHFQRLSEKSLFTGLKAKTHFGRPNFEVFFDSLQLEHPNVERIGVFSCGPGPMTNNVQQACEALNRKEGAIFIHHFENF